MSRQRPDRSEAPEYFFTYIDKVRGDDVRAVLAQQEGELSRVLAGVNEDRSLFRYAEGKWSIREVVGHVNDCERLFMFRALWFARGFASPLPAFDQNVAIATAAGDARPLAEHLREFSAIRAATVAFIDNLPDEAWSRTGIASDYTLSVRALLFLTAGHAAHHIRQFRDFYQVA